MKMPLVLLSSFPSAVHLLVKSVAAVSHAGARFSEPVHTAHSHYLTCSSFPFLNGLRTQEDQF